LRTGSHSTAMHIGRQRHRGAPGGRILQFPRATVAEIMSPHVVSASEDDSLGEIASLLQRHRIKRVPIIKDGKLVGIVSRSNLIQALALALALALASPSRPDPAAEEDRNIRLELLSRLDFGSRNVIVSGGVVHLWGLVDSPEERTALVALAEGVRGVVGVSDEMTPSYA
jgi:CBS domain/BON domain